MKKVVLTSLLACATAVPMTSVLYAQQGGGVQMQPDEYKVYNDANSLPSTSPDQDKAKAAAFEGYLQKYPNSAVKTDVLNQILYLYSQSGDAAKTLDASDKLLAVDPNNLRALTFEVYYRQQAADANTDPAAKCAALDTVAGYATKGLAATKPADTKQDQWDALTKATAPTYYRAIADDDLCKKDNAGAITALKTELAAAPPDQLTQPGPVLQDVFTLANAYYTSTPPDFLNCAWYATRAAAYAGQFAAQITPLATYCYRKYHGKADGYDQLQAMVKTSVMPPDDLATKITAAPKPEDIVAQTIASTPDLAALAISDKEFLLQYGTKKDPKTQTKAADGSVDPASGTSYADEVFDTVKGKSTQFPQVTVLDGSTADTLKVAVTDDAAASKTPDFTFAMKEPLKAVPATGTKLDIESTYASYRANPLMIMMTDGVVIEKKAPAKKTTPARRPVRR